MANPVISTHRGPAAELAPLGTLGSRFVFTRGSQTPALENIWGYANKSNRKPRNEGRYDHHLCVTVQAPHRVLQCPPGREVPPRATLDLAKTILFLFST